MYRSSAWWGSTSATDRQKVKAFIRRSNRAGYYTPDPDYQFQVLCNEADHWLFNIILHSQYHALEQLLPPTLPQSYDFRKWLHTRQIPNRCSYLTDSNVLIRILFADSYWWCFSLVLSLYCLCITNFCISMFRLWFVNFSINKYWLIVIFIAIPNNVWKLLNSTDSY